MSTIRPSLRPATIALHGGQVPDAATNARAVPIYQTTSYVFASVEHAARLFALQQPGHIYTRIGNPTTGVLEDRLAQLDGGVGALALASGQAAITAAILTITSSGQNIVSTSSLYGGTYNLFHHTLARLGIQVRFVDSSHPEHIDAAIDDDTRLVYTESIGNPKNNVDDFEAIAAVAHRHGVPFIVDNTVSPLVFRPLEHGADIVVYSLTKFVGGHGTSIGGAIVDGGGFDWGGGRFPEFTEADPSYHGVVFADACRIARGRTRGAAPRSSPRRACRCCATSARASRRSTRSCSCRASRPCRCGCARTAATHSRWPNGCGEPGRQLGQLPAAAGPSRPWPRETLFAGRRRGDRGFRHQGRAEAGKRLIDSVRLFSHAANIGDAKSLIIHPASTTHQQLSADERVASGVTDDFIRLSIGTEDVSDIVEDLEQAIAASQHPAAAKPLLLVG